MAFQPVPDTFEVLVNYTCNNVQMVNTFYAKKDGGYTSADLEEACELLQAIWEADMLTELPMAYIVNGYTARGLAAENDIEFVLNPTDAAGSIASNPTPNNVAFAISRRSGLTGRSARGRVYIGPLASGTLQTDENLLSATVANNLVDGLNAIAPSFGAAGLTEVIVSRYSNGVKRSAGVTFAVTEYVATNLRVDSRRDRLP